MRIGILGGGLQGCCTALVLAEHGHSVVLLDKNQALLTRTATANEGKIHLGYMYAADPTLATARTMIKGALAFAPFIQRYIGGPMDMITTSTAANYVVHRDSQHSSDVVSHYLADVHGLIMDAAAGRESAYFGLDLSAPPRRWPSSESEVVFNPEVAVAVFETPEVAIDPLALATRLEKCIATHPRIDIQLGRRVLTAEADQSGVRVTSEHADGRAIDRFDHVVNALWDGRLALDAAMGYKPAGPWLHRLKYGITFTLPGGLERLPSITVISGPFGEVISFRNRRIYLTWYPECLRGISKEVAPPDWRTHPLEPERSRILWGTIAGLSKILPGLSRLDCARLPDACVKGGVIVAWGDSDIYDPASRLHQRYEVGITSFGHYHSIDPGKLTLAPYFAESFADRIGAAA